jgi:modulator of FtsH protease HflK
MQSDFPGNGRGPYDEDPLGPYGDTIRKYAPNVMRGLAVLIVVVFAALGIYSVGPGEQGIVRTLGRESGKSGPGLHYRVPLVQDVDVVNVEQIRRLEVGFRGDKREPHEALMITGDENIVEAQMIVQYRVSDPSKYLFRLAEPELALRATAEVALRSMVGRTVIDDVITTGRERVQEETHAWLQRLMDDYDSGVSITEVKLLVVDAPDEVKDAFHDVVRAREEKEKLINQARGYQADLVPRARGEARKMEREAEAYKEERVLRAKGDGARFDAALREYKKAERVTRSRLHLETMERVLSGLERKVVVDGRGASSVLPLLPLAAAAHQQQVQAGGKP